MTAKQGFGSVLILAGEFPPLGGGGVIRVTKLVKYLSRLGWHVQVGTSEGPLGNAVDAQLLAEIPPSVSVIRLRPPGYRASHRFTAQAKNAIPRRSRLFRFLYRSRGLIRNAVAIPDRWLPWAMTVARSDAFDVPDVIVGSGPPHSVHLASALLGRRWNVPFIADLRDEWTLRPLTRSRLPWRRLIESLLERWVLSRATAIVVVSHASQARYATRYPLLRQRLVVIPNGFDPEDLDGVQSAMGQDDGVVVVGYAGSFQVGTEIRPLFEALGNLVQKGIDSRPVRIELMGPFLDDTIDLARRHIHDSALGLSPFVPHRVALERITAWDVALMVATDGEASLAGKLYEYLALRKPVAVIAPEGPATELVRSAKAGTFADPHDIAAIERAVEVAVRMQPGFTGAPREILRDYDRSSHAEEWSRLIQRCSHATGVQS